MGSLSTQAERCEIEQDRQAEIVLGLIRDGATMIEQLKPLAIIAATHARKIEELDALRNRLIGWVFCAGLLGGGGAVGLARVFGLVGGH